MLGFVSLRDIEDLRYKPGLQLECDLHFVADMPLSAYAQVAYTRGFIGRRPSGGRLSHCGAPFDPTHMFCRG